MEPASGELAAFGRRERWAFAASVVALIAVAFGPALTNGFIEMFDDALYVTRNPWVRQGLTWEGIRWVARPGAAFGTYWQPFTWLSLMANVQIHGVRPGPIHATNMALHALAALFLFLALESMTKRPWKSAAVALLFAVHPLQVESVVWAVERKTVLAGAFGMGALLAYAWYVQRRNARWYLAVVGLFTASLLSKPVFVTLPGLLLVLDVWPLGRTALAAPEAPSGEARVEPFRRLLLEKLPLLAIAAAMTAVVAGLSPEAGRVSPWLRVASALTAYWRYVAKVAWPSGLAMFYPQPPDFPVWQVALAGAGLAGTALVLAKARSRVGLGPLAGFAWFVGTMLPASGIARSGLWPHIADRFAYLPIVGLLIAVVWLVGAALSSHERVMAGAAALVVAVAALAARSHVQARRWGDPVVLFETSARATTNNRVAWSNLGSALREQGRLAEARAVFEETIRLMPRVPDGYVNLGWLLHEQGDLSSAERAYRVALTVDPSCGYAYVNLGLVLKARGDREGSVRSFERAIESGIVEPYPYMQLGLGYLSQQRPADAERAFRGALRVDPMYWRAAAHLGRLLASEGRLGEARQLLLEARRWAVLAGEDPSPVDLLLGQSQAAAP